MSDLRAMLGERYPKLATAISATASDWLGHDTPSSPHGWRCEDKTRYPGPCGCDGHMADEVMGALHAVLPDLLAQAWEQGIAAAGNGTNYDKYMRLIRPTNPYQKETDHG